MSGIYGFICRNKGDYTQHLHNLSVWNKEYGHEGHDEILGENHALGCYVEHFLDTIDLPTPVIRRGNLIYVVDALLFNREELLGESEIPLSSVSDEELLVNLIEQNGFAALRTVNGDFAGVIYNTADHTLTLFRDHMGIRPLYIYHDNDLLAFSTEMRGLLAIPGIDNSIDEKQFWLECSGQNTNSLRETHFEQIKCICPASYTTLRFTEDSYELIENRYWRLGEKKIRLGSDEEYQAEMRRLVEDAIRRRADAMSGVLGCELSGGLDSGVISILLNRTGREGCYVSWHIVPEDWPMQPEDERLVIKAICDQEGITCKYLPAYSIRTNVDPDRPEPTFANTPQIGETSCYVASQGGRCVFCGQGGDEGVSHRSNLLETFYHHEYGAYLRNNWAVTKGKKWRILRFGKHLAKQLLKDYPRLMKPTLFRSFDPNTLSETYKNSFSHVFGEPDLFSIDAIGDTEQGGQRLRNDTCAYQSAENNTRYLFPFEDYRVFNYAVSIPRKQFFNNGVRRNIYREAFKDIMPPELLSVTAKDFPSLRNGSPEQAPDISPIAFFEKLLASMKREQWSDYINFAYYERKLSEISPSDFNDGFNVEKYRMWEILYQCLNIQTLQIQAPLAAEHNRR